MHLFKQIVFTARGNPSAPAVAFGGGVVSYGQLASMILAAATAVETLALPEGSPVLLDVRNPARHTALIIALGLLGLPSASIGTGFSLGTSGIAPGALLTDDPSRKVDGVNTLLLDDNWFAYDPATAPYAPLLALPGFSSTTDVVRYVFSSGTTGVPKCVALTGEVLERRIFYTAITILQGRSGAGLNMLGFSTIAGIMAPLLTLPTGMLLCFSSSNEEALQMIRIFNVSMLSLAVIQISGFLKVLGNDPPPASLQLLAVSGARIPPRLMTEARSRLCSNVITGYGSTEMGSMTGGNSVSLGLREGSVGYIRPWVELEAVDQQGTPVPYGQDGILRAKSPEMAFYASSNPDNVELIKDGWFYPGDIGRVYEDGLVVVTGRTNDVINRGGVIVAPELIEEALRTFPSVQDVGVVGVEINGIQQIWAAVVSTEQVDANALGAFVHPTLGERTPERILRVDALPRTSTGKVMRSDLRQQLLQRVQVR